MPSKSHGFQFMSCGVKSLGGYTEFTVSATAKFVYRVPRIDLAGDLSGRGANKELVLLLGFEVQPPQTARLLVYSKAAMLHDVALAAGDDQILVHLESLGLPFSLSFVTGWNPGYTRGASWFFKGITGFVV